MMDKPLGERLRDEALRRVEQGASREWLDAAEQVVRELAEAAVPFTTDDVWRVLPRPRESRALGAVMRALALRGVIRKTGRYINCRAASRHLAPVAEWVGV